MSNILQAIFTSTSSGISEGTNKNNGNTESSFIHHLDDLSTLYEDDKNKFQIVNNETIINNSSSSSSPTKIISSPTSPIGSMSPINSNYGGGNNQDNDTISIPFSIMDNIGFPIPEDEEIKKEYNKYKNSKERLKFINDCKEQWMEYFMTQNGGFYNKVNKNKTIQQMIRKYGIYPNYRNKIWCELNQIDKKLIENEGYYKKMLQVHKNIYNEAEYQIDLDLSRTFPQHVNFKYPTSKGRLQMKRILIAFSWRNPYISYCQSLNFIVATLLLHCDEETAFWLLVVLLEDILPMNYYNPHLTGVRIDSKVFEELVKNRLPKLFNHFQQLQLDCSVFCSGWFMRCFIDVFPVETFLRILDLLFSEGSKILFRAALAYLKLYENDLLNLQNCGEILHFINQSPSLLFDHTKLMKNMFSFYVLTRKEIEMLRMKYKEVVEKEDAEFSRRRKNLKLFEEELSNLVAAEKNNNFE
ncbi:hypothetical protein ABK040_009458 [Willaertia magna]